MGSSLVRTLIGIVVVLAAVGGRALLKPSRDSIIRVDENDARMAAAEQEARARWPEFLEGFRQKKAGMYYSVKYGFPVKGGGQEFIWLEVKSISGGKITGVMDNEPQWDVGHKLGDRVQVPEKEISDWLISDKAGHFTGGFQVKVLRDIERERGK